MHATEENACQIKNACVRPKHNMYDCDIFVTSGFSCVCCVLPTLNIQQCVEIEIRFLPVLCYGNKDSNLPKVLEPQLGQPGHISKFNIDLLSLEHQTLEFKYLSFRVLWCPTLSQY